MCPTRWTVWGSSLESILNNYRVLQTLWEEAKQITHDSESDIIIGVQHNQMSTFNFLFCVVLWERILNHTNNLSTTLQSPSLTAADAHSIADLTCKTLDLIRNDECFDFFWEKVLSLHRHFEISEPCLPRNRKALRTLEVGTSEGDFHASPREYSKCSNLKLLI